MSVTGRSGPSWSERIYRQMLRMYPAAFRERFGRGMMTAYSDALRERSDEGTEPLLRFWLREAWGVMRTAPRERWLTLVRPSPSRTRAGELPPTRNGGGRAPLDGLRAVAEDLRDAMRRLRKRPRFALVSVVVLAAGIGSAGAVLAVLDASMMRALPFQDPDRVVHVYGNAMPRFARLTWSLPNYSDLKARATSFSAMSAEHVLGFTIFTDGPRRFDVLRVESEFFDVVGVEPALGRRILPEDEDPSSELVIVLTHRFWTEQLGGDPDVLGSTLRIAAPGQPATVVGILPEGFEFPDAWSDPQAIIPLRVARATRAWTGTIGAVARLRDGVTLDAADREVKAIVQGLVDAYPEENREPSGLKLAGHVDPFRADLWREGSGRVFLLLVAGAVLLLLMTVCLNTSGLLLARSVDRRHELAVRAAMGAGRWRLARSVFVETGLLTVVGLAGGLGLARVLLGVIQDTALAVPQLDTARIDLRVLGACGGLAVIVWLIAGWAPALLGSRATMVTALKEATRTASQPIHWIRRAIIVLQFGVAAALVTGAVIAIEGYARLTSPETGFDDREVAALRVGLPRDRYTRPSEERPPESPDDPALRVLPEAHQVTDRLIERLRTVPGVIAAAASTSQPFDQFATTGYLHADLLDESIPYADKRAHRTNFVTPGYFEALDIRLLEGRLLEEADDAGATRVVVVNRAFADTLRKEGVEPVGSTFLMHPVVASGAVDVRVVGVVANTVLRGSADAPEEPVVYVPFAQQGTLWASDYWSGMLNMRTFVVRAEHDVSSLLPELRQALWGVHPELPIEASALSSMRRERFRLPRFILALLGTFAAITLLLASTGTFALLAQAVRSRAHEIGIRRALGSSSRAVAMRFLGDAGRMASLGIALGIAFAYAFGNLAATRIPGFGAARSALGVEGWSVGALISVLVVLATAAVFGAWTPAWTASRMDPLEAIRAD